MLVLQTLLVYISFWGTLFLLLKKASKVKGNRCVIYASIAFSLLSGFRYGVGYDFFSYMKGYEYFNSNGFFLGKSEIGFEYLTRLVSALSSNYGVFFAIIGFIQLFYILCSLKKDKYVYPFFAFTFVSSCVWLSYFNGIRQSIAFSLFSYSLLFLIKRNLIKYLIFIIIATLFHKSAILLLIFYPLATIKKEWFHNIKRQIGLLLFSLLVMNINIIQIFISKIEDIISFMGYGIYLEDQYSEKIQNNGAFDVGLGFIITLITNILIVLFSTKTKQWIKSDFFTTIYNFTFVGILINYFFFNSHLIARLNWYLYGFTYLSGAFILYYLYHKQKIWFYILSTLFSLTFIAVMYRMEENTSLYIFNFQEDLYYIKNQIFK